MTDFTVWTPDQPMPPQSGIDGPIVGGIDKKLKYTGAVAKGYDAKREQSPKWIAEQRIIEDMLSDLPRDTTVLDIPVGTGRFLDCYAKRGFQVIAADLSGDMLEIAAGKCPPELRRRFVLADITDLSEITLVDAVKQPTPMALKDNSVDVAVACRISRWLEPGDWARALQGLKRVARDRIIVTARRAPHKIERASQIDVAVATDYLNGTEGGFWRVHQDVAGYEDTYRIIELRCTGAT